MRQLIRYNKFIEGHDVEVRLPPEAEVSWQFLESRRGNILNDRVKITTFNTDNAFVLMVDKENTMGSRSKG